MKYIELVTWNRKMMLMYGDKLTGIQKAIGRRSNGLHTEINFVDRRQFFSCTCADGVCGCRFKPIKRTHPYRQSIVRIYVTDEQEERLWAKACELADWNPEVKIPTLVPLPPDTGCWHGPNHVKYDKWGASFAFILKAEIWAMDRVKMICNEACAEVLLVVWPRLLHCLDEKNKAELERQGNNPLPFDAVVIYKNILDPATLTPDQLHYLVEYYFEHTDRPNQQDIDNIIKEVNNEEDH